MTELNELKHSIQPNQQYITEVESELGIALARKRCFWHSETRVISGPSASLAAFCLFPWLHYFGNKSDS